MTRWRGDIWAWRAAYEEELMGSHKKKQNQLRNIKKSFDFFLLFIVVEGTNLVWTTLTEVKFHRLLHLALGKKITTCCVEVLNFLEKEDASSWTERRWRAYRIKVAGGECRECGSRDALTEPYVVGNLAAPQGVFQYTSGWFFSVSIDERYVLYVTWVHFATQRFWISQA